MIKERQLNKNYLAVVRGLLDKKEGEFTDYLLKEDNGNTIVTTKEKGKLAKLKYKVLEENKSNNLSLVEIELLTGRHHQIRVQFSNLGYPLYGDQLYGKDNKEQIRLFAYKLEFNHPTTKEKLIFNLELPNRYPFNLFKNN